MIPRNWTLAVVAAAAVGSTSLAPWAATKADASSPVALAGLGGDIGCRRPPGPPRFVTATQILETLRPPRVRVDWSVPLDVALGTSCAPVTAYEVGFHQQLNESFVSCGPMRNDWTWVPAGTVGSGTFSKVLPDIGGFRTGYYSFYVRAANMWGWGPWAQGTTTQCVNAIFIIRP